MFKFADAFDQDSMAEAMKEIRKQAQAPGLSVCRRWAEAIEAQASLGRAIVEATEKIKADQEACEAKFRGMVDWMANLHRPSFNAAALARAVSQRDGQTT